ncbi:WhiB family transcriptional regulator [Rhodococcus globerulus]|uniref:Transcriptional regulator WhiB n=1 Tax=Rhodococcus globerulus TaxID=33008 RepID=A0ABU4C5S6_RHOGO|nr:WhiB family transcriptional regulator [Rhodococcus globerulus]MDV6271759.1 WhiB family transcriptional regulator [Rhodococcus globerulus]
MFSVIPMQDKDTEPWQWRAFARCRTEDASIFFPPEGERPTARSTRESAAKRICRPCPVSVECLNFALTTGQQHGIWGMTTPIERNKRRRPPQSRDTVSPKIFRQPSERERRSVI